MLRASDGKTGNPTVQPKPWSLHPAPQAQLSLGGTPRPQRRSNAALAHAHGSRKASAADEFADFVAELRRGIAHGVRATTRC